ncbi:MAG: TlpA family protein disulfide reductase [Alphaproteobacteria bacterium]|nr:TlpA family protein disulfide reductase [Alphaproteobacteria bacterium]MDX5414871.1 TlpA family protein disulfide reductase [Alphaproteobacteria bacterium]MDX5492044.1 TlpA family protein disulfide reductase [Alphaproteobacteria bacterium]
MPQTSPKLLALLAGTALLIAGGVYLIGQGGGNPQAPQTSSALNAAAVGEVANFVPKPVPAAMPEVPFRDAEGRETSLADFRGKLVLLNLWATWCAPCREEMPQLDELQAELGGDAFEVLALSVDSTGPEVPAAFLKQVGASNLAFFHDPSAKANFTLGAFGLPTTILISPDGLEIGRMAGPAHWASEDAKALIRQALDLYGPSPEN